MIAQGDEDSSTIKDVINVEAIPSHMRHMWHEEPRTKAVRFDNAPKIPAGIPETEEPQIVSVPMMMVQKEPFELHEQEIDFCESYMERLDRSAQGNFFLDLVQGMSYTILAMFQPKVT